MPRLSEYSFGRVRIDEKVYTHDVLVLGGEVLSPWVREEGHRLLPEDLEWVLARAPAVLVVGTGAAGRLVVPDETRDLLAARGITVIAERTGKAIEGYNERATRGERVAACLHLTC